MPKTRAKKIDEAMRLTWDSLESHLYWVEPTGKMSKVAKRHAGSRKFHIQCIQEYARVITLLSHLY